MIHRQSAVCVAAAAFTVLLGCGSGRAAMAQPTTTPFPPPSAALQSPSATIPTTGTGQATSAPTAIGSPSTSAGSSPSPEVAEAPQAQEVGWPAVTVELITSQLNQPVHVTHAGDGSGRLFVVEKRGRIVVLRDGVRLQTPFLDITPLVNSGGSEQGLLGLAFHPSYAANGLFYVNYTDRNGLGDTVVARYQVRADNPDVADPNSTVTLLGIEDPATNHNGGNLVFGPDRYLYIGMGDGGRAGDPWGNAQNKSVLLGKMMRLDVDGGMPYGIPPDNPLVNDPAARGEIWAYGLRNPWRYSFDRATGDLYIADVGQNAWEEIHVQRAGAGGGQNYGWNRMEGSHCFPPNRACDPSLYEQPIAEYGSSLGCSIIGGFVYRGPSFPQLQGFYFYGDFCSGRIWALREQTAGDWQHKELLRSPLRISSFGEDEAGEIYLTSLSDSGLYRLAAEP